MNIRIFTISILILLFPSLKAQEKVDSTIKPVLSSGNVTKGDYLNYPQAKIKKVNPELKAISNNGGVTNKEEVLSARGKKQPAEKPKLSAASKPKIS